MVGGVAPPRTRPIELGPCKLSMVWFSSTNHDHFHHDSYFFAIILVSVFFLFHPWGCAPHCRVCTLLNKIQYVIATSRFWCWDGAGAVTRWGSRPWQGKEGWARRSASVGGSGHKAREGCHPTTGQALHGHAASAGVCSQCVLLLQYILL